MIESGDHGLLNFAGRPRQVKGRGISINLPERLRAARRLPEAIVKVASFSHGLHQVSDHLRYISRDGKLELEKDGDEFLRGEEDWKDLVAQWATDFDTRKRSRDAAHIVFSMPRGSDVYALRSAVRATGNRVFGDHEWVFAIHQDTDYPHAHMLVKMRSRDGDKKLKLRKADLYELRQLFAEAAREQGIPLAATPRAARGVGRKPQRQWVLHLKKRGATPLAQVTAVRNLADEVRTQKHTERPWEKAMQIRYETERRSYFTESDALRQIAAKRQGEEREKLEQAASDLNKFASAMSPPKTRYQILKERLRQIRVQPKPASREPEKDPPINH
jgi:hypothetical protein